MFLYMLVRKKKLMVYCFVQINSLIKSLPYLHRVAYSIQGTKVISIQIRGILAWHIY